MNIVITGGAGFLGSALLNSLLANCPEIKEIKLVDRVEFDNDFITSDKIQTVVADISLPEEIASLIDQDTTHVFHLAAIVSSHAEEDFFLGMSVNIGVTQLLLERCRQVNPQIRFIFLSSLAVFGGELPERIEYLTAMQPVSSYGMQKAVCELLINDYARKNFVDAISLRLPTICIRPGSPNKAASSFVSGIIREPLKQEKSNCPVDMDLPLWVSSPDCVIKNILHASQIESKSLEGFRTLNLPGIQTSPREMIASLVKIAGSSCLDFLSYEIDSSIETIVSSWPKSINNSKELLLGFNKDKDFDSILNQYLEKNPTK